MSYNEARLRMKIADALDEFIPETTLPGGKETVVEEVSEHALMMLKLICGDSDSKLVPRGILKP